MVKSNNAASAVLSSHLNSENSDIGSSIDNHIAIDGAVEARSVGSLQPQFHNRFQQSAASGRMSDTRAVPQHNFITRQPGAHPLDQGSAIAKCNISEPIWRTLFRYIKRGANSLWENLSVVDKPRSSHQPRDAASNVPR